MSAYLKKELEDAQIAEGAGRYRIHKIATEALDEADRMKKVLEDAKDLAFTAAIEEGTTPGEKAEASEKLVNLILRASL